MPQLIMIGETFGKLPDNARGPGAIGEYQDDRNF